MIVIFGYILPVNIFVVIKSLATSGANNRYKPTREGNNRSPIYTALLRPENMTAQN
jgi:hypothetical protein